MYTALIIIGVSLVVLGTIYLFVLGWTRGRAEREAQRAHQDWLLDDQHIDLENRYVGGEHLCRICHSPTHYSDSQGYVHPICREANRRLEAQLRDLGETPIPPEARERGLRAVNNLMEAIRREGEA